MTVELGQQLTLLGLALLLGAAGGVLYDIFKILRLIGLNGRFFCFVEDLLFFAVMTVAVFSFQLNQTDGKIRIFVLLSVAGGFALYRLTLERPVFFIIQKLYCFVASIIGFLYRKIAFPVFRGAFLVLRRTVGRPIRAVSEKICIKTRLFFKKRLTRGRKVLYNKAGILKRRKDPKDNDSPNNKTGQKAFYC